MSSWVTTDDIPLSLQGRLKGDAKGKTVCAHVCKYPLNRMILDDDLLMGEGQIYVFFCAQGIRDMLSFVIKLVAAVLIACDQL